MPAPTGICAGRWRRGEDLHARINLWTFELPGLAERSEDVEPNLDFELERFAREQRQQVRFNLEARRRYLAFACSIEARWSGNFRELSASLTRMATLADAGRIDEDSVIAEIERLRRSWSDGTPPDAAARLLGEGADSLDLFDRCQLNAVLEVCRTAPSLSEAGRRLFSVSRTRKQQPNDADRLRKYLARFGLDWRRVAAH